MMLVTKTSASRPTVLKVDTKRQIAMISNRKGEVHIFDLKAVSGYFSNDYL